ncbi:MAG TPA: tripartite tricarboxylate transporter permease [Ferrovibrio sp.]|uniref:tripartite tricarboxylate transporter permease n=1 Tax=Ferrovibrio sp. TaxID=1917215 RepID=UPI002ED34B4B
MTAAVEMILNPQVLGVIALASMFGLFVGAMPGLSATMATALLVPITFFMQPAPAIGAIVTCTAMAIFAGDIPGALLRIPGTPASAAYADEAYRMTQKGLSEVALGAGLLFSMLGGLVGVTILILGAPVLAEFALNFSSFEYFWLALLGLTCAVFITPQSQLKGLVALILGLLISCIGIGSTSGYARFTFDNVELTGGVPLIPALIGMFALPEVIRYVLSEDRNLRITQNRIGNIFAQQSRMLRLYWRSLIRGSLLGTTVGAMPGAGADIAAWISYALSRKFSRTPEKFGTGHPEGIVEASSSNNAALGGAWIPALVFGIPGDSITAIAIGVMFMKGLTPGPMIFLNDPQMLYAVFICFVLANLLLLPFGWVAIKLAGRLLSVPRPILMPLILLFCIVGAFASNNTVFGVTIMLALGMIAYLMEENAFPVAPIILGIVLGPMLEENFINSMQKTQGDLIGFIGRPIAGTLGVLTILIWLAPILLPLARKAFPAMAGRSVTGE